MKKEKAAAKARDRMTGTAKAFDAKDAREIEYNQFQMEEYHTPGYFAEVERIKLLEKAKEEKARDDEEEKARDDEDEKDEDSDETCVGDCDEDGDSLEIFAKMPDGTTVITLNVKTTTTVDMVKHKIKMATGIPRRIQRLVFSGKQLENGSSIADNGIKDQSILYILLCVVGGGRLVKDKTARAATLRTSIEDKAKSLKSDGRIECTVRAESKITQFMAMADRDARLALETLCDSIDLDGVTDILATLENFRGMNTTDAKLTAISCKMWGHEMNEVKSLADTCNGMLETGESCLIYGMTAGNLKIPDLKVILTAAKNQKIGRVIG